MRRLTAWLLALVLLTICVPAMAETRIDLNHSCFGVSKQVAVVTVEDAAINTVKKGSFDANTSYRDGGYGLYNKETFK